MEPTGKPARLGDILLECGLVRQDELDKALAHSRANGMRLGEALIDLGYIDPDAITWAMGNQMDLSIVELSRDMVDWDFLLTQPLDDLREIGFLPLNRVHVTVTGVVGDPTRPGLSDRLAELFPGLRMEVQLASKKDIERMLDEAAAMRVLSRSQDAVSLRGVRSVDRWVVEWRQAVESGVLPYIQVLPAPQSPMDYRVVLPPGTMWRTAEGLNEEEMGELVTRLRGALPAVESGGTFLHALVPARVDGSTQPVRVVALSGAAGHAVGMAALGVAPAGPAGVAAVLTSARPGELKGAFVAAALRLLPPGSELFVLEAFSDGAHPGVAGAEVADPGARCRLARAVAHVFRPRLIVLELGIAAALAHVPWDLVEETGTSLLVLVRSGWDDTIYRPEDCRVQRLRPGDESQAAEIANNLVAELIHHGA